MSDSHTFTVKIDNKDTQFEIKALTVANQREAQKIYNQAFSDAVKSGSIVRAKLGDLMKEQGLWDDKKEVEFKTIQQKIFDKEKQLAKGGISLKQAKTTAIEIKRLRIELRDLISDRTELDTHTAEGQADNARFNYMVSASVVYKDNQKPYFASYEDYLNRAASEVAILGAQKLAAIVYGLDSDFEKKLPENKFLLTYKFVDDNLNYIDNKQRKVDSEGRLLDDQNRFINENGQLVDKDGNLVDDQGNYVVDFKPFLDEDGNPIVIENNKSGSIDENKIEKSTKE